MSHHSTDDRHSRHGKGKSKAPEEHLRHEPLSNAGSRHKQGLSNGLSLPVRIKQEDDLHVSYSNDRHGKKRHYDEDVRSISTDSHGFTAISHDRHDSGRGKSEDKSVTDHHKHNRHKEDRHREDRHKEQDASRDRSHTHDSSHGRGHKSKHRHRDDHPTKKPRPSSLSSASRSDNSNRSTEQRRLLMSMHREEELHGRLVREINHGGKSKNHQNVMRDVIKGLTEIFDRKY